MRFLFTTLQTYESEFYARVGEELRGAGPRRLPRDRSRGASAQALRARGIDARCLPDVARGARRAGRPRGRGPADRGDLRPAAHPRRLPRRLGLRRPAEAWCVARTVRPFRALERIFDDVRPDVLVPEVGNETIRIAAHLIGLRRGIPVLFLLYTIFPDPLRLYVDTLHAPIATQDEVRELSAGGARRRSRRSAASFTAAAKPIREHRRVPVEAPPREGLRRPRPRGKRRSTATTTTSAPGGCCTRTPPSGCARGRRGPSTTSSSPAGRSSTSRCTSRTTTRSQRIIPHCRDQVSLVEQVADALPVGPRPRAEGAPDVARPQQHPPAAAAAAAAERPARRAVHELARADPRLGRRWS